MKSHIHIDHVNYGDLTISGVEVESDVTAEEYVRVVSALLQLVSEIDRTLQPDHLAQIFAKSPYEP